MEGTGLQGRLIKADSTYTGGSGSIPGAGRIKWLDLATRHDKL